MKSATISICLVMLFCLAIPAMGDVVVKHKSNAEMGGLMSMEMSGTDNYKADRSSSETTTKMTGGMMTMMGKGKPTQAINITRLDKAIVWEINPDKKTYTETPLESMKKNLEDAKEESNKQGDEDEYIWTVDVKVSDQKQNINGFDCKEVIATATGVKKDNKADSIYITFDNWLAETVPGSSEIETYQKNYAKAVGVDEMWAQGNMGDMMKSYGNMFEQLGAKVEEAGGFPIKTTMLVETPAKSGDDSGDESGSDVGSMSGMMGKMGKMLGKKQEAEKKEASKNGRIATFSVTNEVLSVEQKAVGDDQFEVPRGYKKK